MSAISVCIVHAWLRLLCSVLAFCWQIIMFMVTCVHFPSLCFLLILNILLTKCSFEFLVSVCRMYYTVLIYV